MAMNRLLGIDYGERRIGLAISDPTGIIALPLKTLVIRGIRHALAEIKLVAAEKNITGIVLGLPLALDGTAGLAAENVKKFASALESHLNLPVTFWGERLSTAMVERTLISADVRREQRRDVRDKLAAQVILQSYLDSIQP